jgi:hypothetical protein
MIEEVMSMLNVCRVKYLLIGGLASVLHGVPRTTVDIDIAVLPSEANVRRTIDALKKVGLTCDTENADDIIAQGGITFSNKLSIDVLTSLPGKMDFESIWERRSVAVYRDVKINVVSKADQIKMLKAVGRAQDLEDAGTIERHLG